GRGDAETHLLALHVPAGLRQCVLVCRLVHAYRRQVWIASLLRAKGDEGAQEEDEANSAEERPALLFVARHVAKHVDQPSAQREDGEHLDEIGEGRRVLEGM